MAERIGIPSGDGDEVEADLLVLHESLHAACRRHDEWPAKVAAAVYAALEFASAEPDRVLGLLSRAGGARGGERSFKRTVQAVSALLAEVAPRRPGGTGPVQGIAMIVYDHLRSGRADSLVELGPALVQFALQPYLGYVEAKGWADRQGPRPAESSDLQKGRIAGRTTDACP